MTTCRAFVYCICESCRRLFPVFRLCFVWCWLFMFSDGDIVILHVCDRFCTWVHYIFRSLLWCYGCLENQIVFIGTGFFCLSFFRDVIQNCENYLALLNIVSTDCWLPCSFWRSVGSQLFVSYQVIGLLYGIAHCSSPNIQLVFMLFSQVSVLYPAVIGSFFLWGGGEIRGVGYHFTVKLIGGVLIYCRAVHFRVSQFSSSRSCLILLIMCLFGVR